MDTIEWQKLNTKSRRYVGTIVRRFKKLTVNADELIDAISHDLMIRLWYSYPDDGKSTMEQWVHSRLPTIARGFVRQAMWQVEKRGSYYVWLGKGVSLPQRMSEPIKMGPCDIDSNESAKSLAGLRLAKYEKAREKRRRYSDWDKYDISESDKRLASYLENGGSIRGASRKWRTSDSEMQERAEKLVEKMGLARL